MKVRTGVTTADDDELRKSFEKRSAFSGQLSAKAAEKLIVES
jgi:hypothetical protein